MGADHKTVSGRSVRSHAAARHSEQQPGLCAEDGHRADGYRLSLSAGLVPRRSIRIGWRPCNATTSSYAWARPSIVGTHAPNKTVRNPLDTLRGLQGTRLTQCAQSVASSARQSRWAEAHSVRKQLRPAQTRAALQGADLVLNVRITKRDSHRVADREPRGHERDLRWPGLPTSLDARCRYPPARRRASSRAGSGQRTSLAQPRRSNTRITSADRSI